MTRRHATPTFLQQSDQLLLVGFRRRDKALLAELAPHQQQTVLQVMKNHPEIPLAETIAMLKALGL